MHLRVLGSIGAISALLFAQLAFLAAPVAAANPTLVVTADMPSAVPAGHNWSFDDFFPRALTVKQGTTIGFAIEGFHTATLLPAGVTAAQDIASHGFATTDAEDTAPNVNGTTHSQFAILNVLPKGAPAGCGTAATPCTFDGTSVVSSGAPLSGPPSGPFVVKVTAALGSYIFHCRIHPKMSATLNVVAKADPSATTPAQLSAAVTAQVATDVAAGHAAEGAANAAGVTHNANGTNTWHLSAGTSSPDGHTVILEMLPEKVTIRRGDTVTWTPKGLNEVHTVTFPTDPHTDQVPLCENGTTDKPAIPTVIPPTGPGDFKCAVGPVEIEAGGGNGVTTITKPTTVSDSGIISGTTADFSLPATALLPTWTVHFTGAVAGTYTYVCQIHQGMQGTIVVAAAVTVTPPPTSTDTVPRPGSGPTALLALVILLLATVAATAVLATRRRQARL
jgi:plastocyanin